MRFTGKGWDIMVSVTSPGANPILIEMPRSIGAISQRTLNEEITAALPNPAFKGLLYINCDVAASGRAECSAQNGSPPEWMQAITRAARIVSQLLFTPQRVDGKAVNAQVLMAIPVGYSPDDQAVILPAIGHYARGSIECTFGLPGGEPNCSRFSVDSPNAGLVDSNYPFARFFAGPPISEGTPRTLATALVWYERNDRVVLLVTPDSGPTTEVTMPGWRVRPTSETTARFYPERAQRAGVAGSALVVCAIDLGGSAHDCTVISETPPDYGFGAAVASVLESSQFWPAEINGTPVPDFRIRVPLLFKMPGD